MKNEENRSENELSNESKEKTSEATTDSLSSTRVEPSDAENVQGSSRKKRVSERQLTKDDAISDYDEDDSHGHGSGVFEKADAETLKKRR